MTGQTYATHVHRPLPTAIAAILTLVALVFLVGSRVMEWDTLHLGVILLAFAVFVLVAISRLYIVKLQDRIILLEMKMRCAEVLPAGQDTRLNQLTPKQIVALRFAPDEELGDLLDLAARDKMPPAEIKRAIKNWRGDYLRT